MKTSSRPSHAPNLPLPAQWTEDVKAGVLYVMRLAYLLSTRTRTRIWAAWATDDYTSLLHTCKLNGERRRLRITVIAFARTIAS